jgi:serine/threonine protein kinase
VSDAQALEWLGRLLDLDAAQRAAQLETLAQADGALHARVSQLVAAAEASDGSRVLGGMVMPELRASSGNPLPQAGHAFAGYRLLREIGRGGMAVVWLAERVDGLIKRPVALKLPILGSLSAADAERFAREKDVLAALTHPNIARLYDAGVGETGQPFIVLEFVDGAPITRYCNEHKLDLAARVRLFLEVLAAVEYAHKHLVVHRDLKPSNILVDAQRSPKLLDFGIARLLDDPARPAAASQLTQSEGSPLTPFYASPEQVSSQTIGTFTDVFAAGMVLHELLSGASPYGPLEPRPPLAQVVQMLMRGDPVRLSQAAVNDANAQSRGFQGAGKLRAALGGDLEAIVQKALRREPAQRYASIAHFADDLRRYQEHEPIAARRASAWHSTTLFLRRHRNASIAAACGALLALATGAYALQSARQSARYEARSLAVRDFMFDLINDAEPNENQPDAPVGIMDILGSAEWRARTDFAAQPALQGELLSELGRMHVRSGDAEKGRGLLREALALLERNVGDRDPGLNKTRAHLADALRNGETADEARALAEKARDACTGDSIDCAKARSYALTILGSLELRDGETNLALSAMREAVQETARGFGETHPETAMSMQRLAVIARNAGYLREASDVMMRALALSSGATLRKKDRTALHRTMAVIDLELGHQAAARARLEELLSTSTDPRERALQLRMLANAWLADGEPRKAFATANLALELSNPARTTGEKLFAQQTRARALALLGDAAGSLAELDLIIAALPNAGYSQDSTELIRARRLRAETLLRADQPQEALRELDALVARLEAAAQPSALEFGQVLDLHGCALRELDRAADAQASHERARIQLLKSLPPDHPFLIRNSLYKEAAADNIGQFQLRAQEFNVGLPVSSIWRRLIEVELEPSSCARTGLPKCVFVL